MNSSPQVNPKGQKPWGLDEKHVIRTPSLINAMPLNITHNEAETYLGKSSG
jgi:hypothetical protein